LAATSGTAVLPTAPSGWSFHALGPSASISRASASAWITNGRRTNATGSRIGEFCQDRPVGAALSEMFEAGISR
jgi:hypothetical protein